VKCLWFAVILNFACLSVFLPWPVGAGETKDSGRQVGQVVSETQFREAFTRYLCTHLRKPVSDVVVSKFKVSENPPVPGGPVILQIFQKERGAFTGLVRVAAMVSVNGAVHHEASLSGWVDVFESAVCAARPLRKGEILKKEDLYLTRENVSRLQGQALTNVDKAVGLMVRHSVRQNTCLKEWMLEKAPVLDKGAAVTILAHMGGLRVTVRGVALERGYPGEMVKVQNSMSQKAILARVIDSAHVMVEF
jgi:flagella basal body P-ring formation protein FlgA